MGFKKKKCISIDFGSKYIKLAVGEYKNDHLIIDKLISEEIGDDIWSDGRILDSDRLKNIVYGMLKSNNIKINNVSFTISSSKIVKREIEVPKVDAADRLNLIKYEIEQYLPDDVENYVFQYKVIDDVKVNEELYDRIFVAVIPRIIVDEYYQLAIDMKLNPALLDIHCNSIVKAINYNYNEFFKNDNGIVAVDIGNSNM
ncbi:pilus assembly protein PilM, partial [Clostridiaceae bacterium HSG29]|nr:pilus assembly protein PilM [Clostridiaceae bacterium HSG29]